MMLKKIKRSSCTFLRFFSLKTFFKHLWHANQQIYCFVTANVINFSFVGENTDGTNAKKCAKQFKRKPTESQHGNNRFCHTKPGKRGPSDMHKNNSIKMKIFLPNPPAQWVKKPYPLLFSKYEIQKGRHLYRTHKKAGISQCTSSE